MSEPTASPSVLIVDDDPRIREILVRWLEPAGYRTQQAAHSEAALEAIAGDQPAVAMCDVEMPGPDGLWLVGRLRERYPNIAIVLCTGVSAVPPTISLQAGVVGYVLKPFQRDQLLATVKQAVEWHRAAVAQGDTGAKRDALEEWLRGGERRG